MLKKVLRAEALKMNKFDIYEVVTRKIIDRLEEGVVPWKMPWRTTSGMPRNLVTNRNYNGINFWMLLCNPFPTPFYMTFEQSKALNGNIRKGEKSTMVVFWKLLESVEKNGDIKKTPFLRYYNVFNLSQTEGIDLTKVPPTEAFDHGFNSIGAAEAIIHNWKASPKIVHGESHAYYSPVTDTVGMPDPRTFFHDEQYYSTLYHEAIHSCGHKSRLGRHEKIKDHQFDSQEDYSQEELCAEMGAAYLCGITGIEQDTIQNNAAYIKSWIRTLKDDPKVLVMAAAQAQKSVDYILNHQIDVNGEIDHPSHFKNPVPA
jgi:antirestriction protein ArdC